MRQYCTKQLRLGGYCLVCMRTFTLEDLNIYNLEIEGTVSLLQFLQFKVPGSAKSACLKFPVRQRCKQGIWLQLLSC
jgi:hypothetical protein